MGAGQRDTNLLIFREFLSEFLLSIVLAVSLTAVALAQENVASDGVLLRGKTVVLFGRVSTCAAEGQIPAAQVFISLNDGKTWDRRGPLIEGSTFEYVLDDGITLRVAGSHTAEGPEIDPFLLMSTGDLSEWKLHKIYRGPSELRSVALNDNGQLVAWIKHIDPHRERWEGPTYAYESRDNGATWGVLGPVPKGTTTPAGRVFSKIEKEDRGWRVVDMEGGGFEVQHLEVDHSWKTAHKFPLQMCRQ